MSNNLRRVEVFRYTKTSRQSDGPSFLNLSSTKPYYDMCRSNMHLYATERKALDAGLEDFDDFVILITIIKLLATLPEEQIKQLEQGLPWSSDIHFDIINLEEIDRTEYPLDQ